MFLLLCLSTQFSLFFFFLKCSSRGILFEFLLFIFPRYLPLCTRRCLQISYHLSFSVFQDHLFLPTCDCVPVAVYLWPYSRCCLYIVYSRFFHWSLSIRWYPFGKIFFAFDCVLVIFAVHLSLYTSCSSYSIRWILCFTF